MELKTHSGQQSWFDERDVSHVIDEGEGRVGLVFRCIGPPIAYRGDYTDIVKAVDLARGVSRERRWILQMQKEEETPKGD